MENTIPIRELPVQSVLSLRPICIGYQLEHMATQVCIDASPWLERWPGAELAVIVKRPGEDTSYPAKITVQDGIIQWMVTRYDTEKAGMGGNMLVIALLDGREAASNTAPLSILPRGSGDINPDTPLPQPPWASAMLEAAKEYVAQAEEASERAEDGWRFGQESQGKLIYVGEEGTPVPLAVGKGLAIDDEALKNALYEKWEFIREIETGEGERIVTISEALTQFQVFIEVPQAEANSDIMCEVYFKSLGFSGYVIISAGTSTSGMTYSHIGAVKEGAALLIKSVYGRTYTNNQANFGTVTTKYLPADGLVLNKISAYRNGSGVNWPAGTKFTVYGVRADA